MGAPKGNQFWKLASKHGRDKIFATPQLMWEAAVEYFEWCEANPLLEHDYVGKDATEVNKRKMRAFTWGGLCLYLGCNTKYFNDFRDSLKDKTDKISKEYSEVIARIDDVIYTQKFTGAAAGFLNPNIIARDLGLRDKADVDHTTGGEKLPPAIDLEKLAKKINGSK